MAEGGAGIGRVEGGAAPGRRAGGRGVEVHEEARDWLAANWDPTLTVRAWWARAAEAGWLFPTWPEGLGGRSLSVGDGRRVAAAFVAAGALGPPTGLGQIMGGPVVLRHGSE